MTAPVHTELARPDSELLSAFARGGSQPAFAELVNRHARWVFAVAFRQLHDRQLAEDATQAVFLLLSQKAHAMAPHHKLSGWLFQTTQYVVRGLIRTRNRQQRHEREAAQSRDASQNRDMLWSQCQPSLADDLDLAVGRLSSFDQAAILLRFYQGLDFEQVARSLQITEPAARKRVTRAVARLREMLGATVSDHTLASAAIVGFSAAPSMLAHNVLHATTIAAAGGTIAPGTATAANGASYLMTLAKLKIAAAAIAAATLVAASSYPLLPFAQAQSSTTPSTPPSPAAPLMRLPNSVAADDKDMAEFKRLYALKDNQVLARIAPPFPPQRLTFFRLKDPGQYHASPRGPDTMTLRWENDDLNGWSMTFGASKNVKELIESVMSISAPEVEGEKALTEMSIPGDFVFKRGATNEQYCQAIEAMLQEEMGTPATLSFRDVDRPVYVLRGRWNYKPVDARSARDQAIELYGADLNKDRNSGGGGGGNAAAWAGWVGRLINKQILLEAEGVPDTFYWHDNHEGNGSRQSRAAATNPQLVLKHIEEQTGLTCTEETRKVRRLFIERGGL